MGRPVRRVVGGASRGPHSRAARRRSSDRPSAPSRNTLSPCSTRTRSASRWECVHVCRPILRDVERPQERRRHTPVSRRVTADGRRLSIQPRDLTLDHAPVVCGELDAHADREVRELNQLPRRAHQPQTRDDAAVEGDQFVFGERGEIDVHERMVPLVEPVSERACCDPVLTTRECGRHEPGRGERTAQNHPNATRRAGRRAPTDAIRPPAAKLDADIARCVERLADREFEGPVSRLRSGAVVRS